MSALWRKLLLCLMLGGISIVGAPLRPEEIEDLLRVHRQARIEATIRKDRTDADAPGSE